MEEEYIEEEIYQPTDKIELTKEEYERIIEDLQIAQLQLQEANDTLNGGITAVNMASFRNTYVINAQDSLDDTYPMYVHFNVLDETVKIVSVKVSFWIMNYRAYSKAGAAGGGQTSSATGSASGGGSTSGSGGGQTSESESVDHLHPIPVYHYTGSTRPVYWSLVGHFLTNTGGSTQYASTIEPTRTHTHTISNHTHTTPAHTHPSHTHTIDNHTHTAAYGIFEEDTTPTITFSVSQDGGIGYGTEYGKVAIDQSLIDITDSVTTIGNKIIKFESTTRARLSVQVEVKLDIKVR